MSDNSALRWVFTSFNEQLDSRFDDANLQVHAVDYLIAQQEIAPTTGRLHWQGFVIFSRRKRFSTVARFLGPDRLDVRVARGTSRQCVDYCSKEESRAPSGRSFVYGTLDESSVETTRRAALLERAISAVSSGQSLSSIASENPVAFVRYGRGLRDFAFECRRPRGGGYHPVHTAVYYGTAGCGKTRGVMDWASRNSFRVYWKTYSKASPSWWDGYSDEEVILCDDFEGESSGCDVVEFLHLNHGYGHLRQWPIKGGFTWLSPVKFIIYTSNSHPCRWFNDGSKTEAVKRRIDTLCDVDKDSFIAPPCSVAAIPSPSPAVEQNVVGVLASDLFGSGVPSLFGPSLPQLRLTVPWGPPELGLPSSPAAAAWSLPPEPLEHMMQ